MAKTRNHPKNKKTCIFCNYWIGDADMKFVNSTVGYEYELAAKGSCTKRNCSTPTHVSCQSYEPSMDAKDCFNDERGSIIDEFSNCKGQFGNNICKIYLVTVIMFDTRCIAAVWQKKM